MNDKDKVQIFAYKCLLTELIPFVEALDAEGLIRYIEQKWPLSQIVLFANTINMLAACKTLEEQEAWLSGIFHVEALSCFLALGWWGAVAGDERDKINPFEKTLEQLEETINRKGDGQDYFKRLIEDMRKDIKRGADAAEAARDTATEVKATGDETRGLAGEIRWNQMTAEEKRRLAGKGGAAKGAGATSPKIIKARDEAARDLQEACRKVRGHLDKGSSLDVACREVCDQFRELPGSKKGGKTWEPLLSARLDAKGSRIRMEPTALMRRYREWCKENGLPSPREQAKQAKTRKRGQ